jgi:hypothetical protein
MNDLKGGGGVWSSWKGCGPDECQLSCGETSEAKEENNGERERGSRMSGHYKTTKGPNRRERSRYINN